MVEKIALPRCPGVADIGDDVSVCFEYYQSGEFLNVLAGRVIAGQQKHAEAGGWNGGRPPYGFVRVLVDPQGKVEELPPGRTVKQAGYHVSIRPQDMTKIKIWALILDLKHQGWGGKRIAHHLNKVLHIPSPDAGRIRTDYKVRHYVSGKWSHRTVLELCDNSAIIGESEWGRRSEGKHRRISASLRRYPFPSAARSMRAFRTSSRLAFRISAHGGWVGSFFRG